MNGDSAWVGSPSHAFLPALSSPLFRRRRWVKASYQAIEASMSFTARAMWVQVVRFGRVA